MSILAALTQAGRTFLIGNLDAADAVWKRVGEPVQGAVDWAVENRANNTMPIALNNAGLGQLWLTEQDGKSQRALFSQGRDVGSGLAHVERLLGAATFSSGQMMLADSQSIARLSYGAGPVGRETRTQGYLVYENEGIGNAVERDEGALSLRSERMHEGIEDLYAWLPILDNEDIVERCRALLHQEPIHCQHTSISVVIDLQERRVDCAVGGAQWQTVWLKTQ